MSPAFDPSSRSFGRYLLAAAPVLILALVALDPAPSRGLELPARALFWALHVGIGLGLLALLQSLLPRSAGRRRSGAWLSTLGVGVLGGLLFAPVALGVERWLEVPEDFDGSAGESLEAVGPLRQAAGEAAELLPSFTAVWLSLNLPWLLRLERPIPAAREGTTPPAAGTPPAAASPPPLREEASSTPDPSAVELFERLPPALGRDLVALSSELHYLRVHTVRGKTLVLYNLRDAVAQLSEELGMQVHRSHWVALEHVRTVEKAGQRMQCVMSNGIRIPVSRRHQRAVAERFGLRSEIASGPADERPEPT